MMRRPYRQLIEEAAAEVGASWAPIEESAYARRYYGGNVADRVRQGEPLALYYWRGDRRGIATPPLTNFVAYFLGLHEVGHFATEMYRRTRRTSTHTILRHEVAAWGWAMENSRYRVTETACREAARGFTTYVRGFSPLTSREAAVVETLHPRIRRYVGSYMVVPR